MKKLMEIKARWFFALALLLGLPVALLDATWRLGLFYVGGIEPIVLVCFLRGVFFSAVVLGLAVITGQVYIHILQRWRGYRVEWWAANGFSGHGQWIGYQEAWEAAACANWEYRGVIHHCVRSRY